MTYTKGILLRDIAKIDLKKPTLFFFILRMKKKKRVWAQWGMDKSWLLESFRDFTRLLEKSTAKPAALRGSFGIILRRVEGLLCSNPFEPTFVLDYVEDLDTKPAQIGKISCYFSDSHIQEEKL